MIKLPIDAIDIGNRIRHDIGDVTELKESIQAVGLLNPIIINSNNELLSGLRRLEACRQLGWTEIEVRIVETDSDELKNLDLEYHENIGRLDFNDEDEEIYLTRRDILLNPPKSQIFIIRWLKTLWNHIARFLSGKKM
ncbi:ParB N-terminal domain-containing protein [candidate division KSB1 bacterium]|nr:ParB N-terminal domain-containing protein [candidate division KSB1 bacterium]